MITDIVLDAPTGRLVIDTKFYPNVHGLFNRSATHLVLADMRNALEESLTALGAEAVDLWYLHAPDRSVPIEETLKGVNDLYKAGKFKKWGVSNFMAWEGKYLPPLSQMHRS